jgi:hypothetical protein
MDISFVFLVSMVIIVATVLATRGITAITLMNPAVKHTVKRLPRFTKEEVDTAKLVLTDLHKIPNPQSDDGQQTRLEHFSHCMYQVMRFAKMFQKRNANVDDLWERIAQISMNYGRAQELITGIGGRRMWWIPYEEIWNERDWQSLEKHIENICSDLNVNINLSASE